MVKLLIRKTISHVRLRGWQISDLTIIQLSHPAIYEKQKILPRGKQDRILNRSDASIISYLRELLQPVHS
jgi:hypothetical protein